MQIHTTYTYVSATGGDTYTYIDICISYWLDKVISTDTGHMHVQTGIYMLMHVYTNSPPTYRHIQAIYTPYKHI